MFYVLTDVYIKEGDVVYLYTDVPHGMLHRIQGTSCVFTVYYY